MEKNPLPPYPATNCKSGSSIGGCLAAVAFKRHPPLKDNKAAHITSLYAFHKNSLPANKGYS